MFLATVKEVVALRNGMLLVSDDVQFPLGENRLPLACIVTLRRPDGSSVRAEGTLTMQLRNQHPCERPPLACFVSGVRKAEVPCGTEVWWEQGEKDRVGARGGSDAF